jgi:hypothetical protein
MGKETNKYGDVYLITIGGNIFTFFVLMVGFGIVASALSTTTIPPLIPSSERM